MIIACHNENQLKKINTATIRSGLTLNYQNFIFSDKRQFTPKWINLIGRCQGKVLRTCRPILRVGICFIGCTSS